MSDGNRKKCSVRLQWEDHVSGVRACLVFDVMSVN